MECALHAVGIPLVPALDVIHCCLADAAAVGGGRDMLADGALRCGGLSTRRVAQRRERDDSQDDSNRGTHLQAPMRGWVHLVPSTYAGAAGTWQRRRD